MVQYIRDALVIGPEYVPILYAIYENPSDYPGKFVVRLWVGVIPCEHPWAVTDTIDEARDRLPRHLINIGRMDGDDAVIKEVWCSQNFAKHLEGRRL